MIVDGAAYLAEVKGLILEYTASLGRDLSFQHLEEELANPGAKYTAPRGELLVALVEGQVLGMVAYQQLSPTRCEMKRLYVSPAGRGQNLGRALIGEILSRATAAGFQEMVLDTIPPLQAAIHLYTKMGFVPWEAYYNNPMDDVIYLGKSLS